MAKFPVSEFLILYGLALLGAIAIIPYGFSLSQARLAAAKLSRTSLALISFVQTAIIMGVATALGLLAAKPVGLGAPYIESALAGKPALDQLVGLLPLAIGVGVLAFVILAILERFVFAAHVPEALRTSDSSMAAWKRFLASFYGGIDEEILMRLFLVSGVVWVLGRFWQNASGLPADGAYWIAIFLVAVVFGLGHLPATRAITPLTPMLVMRAIALNGVAAIIFGWLYWQYGLETAMISHFSADILLHLIAPIVASRIYSATPR